MPREPEPAPEAAKQGSSPLLFAIIAGIVVMVMAIAGLLVYQFVLAPRLGADDMEADGTGSSGVLDTGDDTIPPNVATMTFPDMTVSVIPGDPNQPAPILMFQVALAVEDAATLPVIENNMSWFTSAISDLHQFKTREELNDPIVKQSLLRQARQEANNLLRQLTGSEEHRVVRVMHTQYTVMDL